jgi:hypothetical protein
MRVISHTHSKGSEILPLSPEDERTTTAPSRGYCTKSTWLFSSFCIYISFSFVLLINSSLLITAITYFLITYYHY